MNFLVRVVAVAAVTFTATPAFSAWLFDFGGGAVGNVNNFSAFPEPQDLSNAIDTTGASTSLDFTQISLMGFATAPNTSGTDTPGAPASDFFSGDMTNDNLFGFFDFQGLPERELVEYTISGLTPSAEYNFTFFASRMGVSDNRETQYDLVGATSGQALLNPSNNTTDVAQILDIQADGNGELTLSVQTGPNNDNFSEFFYLGALHIEAVGGGGLAGDFDDDSDVDGADFLKWQQDGLSASDLTDWENNFGAPALASVASVPEPSSLGLLLLAIAGLGVCKLRG